MSLFGNRHNPGAVCFGGGGDTSSTTTTSPVQSSLVTALLPLLQQVAPQLLGNVTNFTSAFPLTNIIPLLGAAQQISPLTAPELQVIGQQYGRSQAPAITPEELMSLNLANQLAGGPIGSSPATVAGMDAFTKLSTPGIMQGAALAGLSHGGAVPEAISQGQTAALVPLLQQEIQNRMTLVPELAGIGGAISSREAGNLSTALSSLGLPRQVADAQNAANYQAQVNQANAIQGIGTGTASSFFGPILSGATSTGSTSKTTQQTPGLFSK